MLLIWLFTNKLSFKMKRKKFFFFLLLIQGISFANTFSQNHYTKYPSYETVVNRFFDDYSMTEDLKTFQLRFEKKPQGWYVVLSDYYDVTKELKNGLFWDIKKEKFQKIDFSKKEKGVDDSEKRNALLDDWSKIHYNLCPFYGYPGWDKDVIAYYDTVKNLPDSIVYVLGRAYSSYASNLINNNSGLAEIKDQFVIPEGKNSLTPEQLEKYRFYRHKAIDRFSEVLKMNPSYQTFVGGIDVKTANEYMVSFLDLRVYQNETEAQKEIKAGLYSDFYISVAKNYLNSCAKNAILFTNGDNDTYPLLYVQAQYGFRTDVLVVNISLLTTARYINSLRDSVLTAPPYPMTLTPDEISGNKREVIMLSDEFRSAMEISKVMDFIHNDSNLMDYGTVKYYYSPTRTFNLSYGTGAIEWKPEGQYFFRNHLMMLDMLAVNAWKRPVYFANTMSNDSYFGLSDYFRQDGMAYRLVTEMIAVTDYGTGHINSDTLYNVLMSKFIWKGFDKLQLQEKLLAINTRLIFSRLSINLVKDNKPDSARLVLAKCEELMPDAVLRYDYSVLQMIEAYYQLKDTEKANAMAIKLAYNLQKGIDNVSGNKFLARFNQTDRVLEELKKTMNTYGQDGIVKW